MLFTFAHLSYLSLFWEGRLWSDYLAISPIHTAIHQRKILANISHGVVVAVRRLACLTGNSMDMAVSRTAVVACRGP